VTGIVLHRAFLLPRERRQRKFYPDEFGIEGAWKHWPG
jgi:hypothetical protein